jgi:hypothetical protein
MVLFNRVKKAALVCAALLLIGQQGCSSRPVKSPVPPLSGVSGEEIGTVIKSAGRRGLENSRKGSRGFKRRVHLCILAYPVCRGALHLWTTSSSPNNRGATCSNDGDAHEM